MALKKMTYDKWADKFKPLINPETENEQFDCHEPADLELVEALADDCKVWTLLDCDGKLYIGAGVHYVNRFAYIITKFPYAEGDEYNVKY